MAGRRQQIGHKLKLIHPCLDAHLAHGCHMVECLRQVSRMRLVVVSYVLVERCYFADEGEEFDFVYGYFFEDAGFGKDVSNRCLQLSATGIFTKFENIKRVELYYFQFLNRLWIAIKFVFYQFRCYRMLIHQFSARR